MSDIIMRSRAGFWSAFRTPQGPVLNIRARDGENVSVILTCEDVEALQSSDASVAHARADHLAAHGPRLEKALPTPPLGRNEPPAHESRLSENDRRRELGMAA